MNESKNGIKRKPLKLTGIEPATDGYQPKVSWNPSFYQLNYSSRQDFFKKVLFKI